MKKGLIIILLFFGFVISCTAQKISELPETTTITESDLFVVVITAGTRKMTWNNILGEIIDSALVLFPVAGEYLTAGDLDTSDVAIPELDSTTANLVLWIWTDTTKAYRKQLSLNFQKIDSTAFFIDTVNSGFWMDGDTLKILYAGNIPGFQSAVFTAIANYTTGGGVATADDIAAIETDIAAIETDNYNPAGDWTFSGAFASTPPTNLYYYHYLFTPTFSTQQDTVDTVSTTPDSIQYRLTGIADSTVFIDSLFSGTFIKNSQDVSLKTRVYVELQAAALDYDFGSLGIKIQSMDSSQVGDASNYVEDAITVNGFREQTITISSFTNNVPIKWVVYARVHVKAGVSEPNDIILKSPMVVLKSKLSAN
jgi:hypothetical protein